MVVGNVWGLGQASTATVPQLRPFCCIDFSAKKSTNFSFIFNWGCGVLHNRTSSKISLSSNYNRIRKSSDLCFCRCSNDNSDNSGTSCSSLEWDWNRWTRHFSEIAQVESFASVLRFQLEDAIEKEDFLEAAKLKVAIAEATSKDTVAVIMSELKNAVEEERYHDASRLCKYTGSGLVGWWVGYSSDSDDPFGKLVHITPGVGRFVGRSYSPRQLVTTSPGTPLFEIFVVKDADGRYVMQVVCLQRPKGSSTNHMSSPTESAKGKSPSEVENSSVVDVQENEVKDDGNEDKGIHLEGATEEGIKSVINFLKEKIPGLKVKVMNVNATGEVMEDSESVKQLMHEDDEKSVSSENAEDEDKVEEVQNDGVSLAGDGDSSESGKDLDMKLFIGGVVHNKEDNTIKEDYVRLPAEIKDVEKDSFLLHVPGRSQDDDNRESRAAKLKMAGIAAKGVSELMPPEVVKAFWGLRQSFIKGFQKCAEIVKLAVSQAQRRSSLSEYTTFNRITTSNNSLDPFEGLYVGAFGPYGIEVVQLRRKYGHWNGLGDKASDVEFFEYVEAVKLTGDLNVPAGQVTFRAKIGKGSRIPNVGTYPDELGNGEGRIAELGFRNPQWVEGELLQLNGKGMGSFVKGAGADLGFLYVVPDQSFLLLFNRLKLPE